jgi:hypothetical protein
MLRFMSLLGASLVLAAVGGMAWAEPAASSGEDPHCRAGHPTEVSCLAAPSNTHSFVGYYVGGGSPCPHLAEPRCVNEGTWGWDYAGCVFRRRVILAWWHGRCYQGGTGAYKSDGPKLKDCKGEK